MMRMFQKGLPVKLGKSPNEKTKPVITIHKKYPNNEATKGQQPKTNQALEPQVPNAQLPTPSLPPVISTCRSRMYLPYLDCISVNISYQSRIISQYRARQHSYKKSLQSCILTTTFQKALDDQEAAVTLHYAHPPAPDAHPPVPNTHPPAPH